MDLNDVLDIENERELLERAAYRSIDFQGAQDVVDAEFNARPDAEALRRFASGFTQPPSWGDSDNPWHHYDGSNPAIWAWLKEEQDAAHAAFDVVSIEEPGVEHLEPEVMEPDQPEVEIDGPRGPPIGEEPDLRLMVHDLVTYCTRSASGHYVALIKVPRPVDLTEDAPFRQYWTTSHTDPVLLARRLQKILQRFRGSQFYVIRQPVRNGQIFRNEYDPETGEKTGERIPVDMSGPDPFGAPPRIKDLEGFDSIPIDLDPAKGADLEEARREAITALDTLEDFTSIPLCYVMDSGRGVQAKIQLPRLVQVGTPDAEAVQRLARRVCQTLRHFLNPALVTIDPIDKNQNRQTRGAGVANAKTGRRAHFIRENPEAVLDGDPDQVLADVVVPEKAPRQPIDKPPRADLRLKWTQCEDHKQTENAGSGDGDPISVWLAETGHIIRRDGEKLIIECPWADGDPETKYPGHTDDGTPASREAAYFPLGSGGRDQRGFNCFHSHAHGTVHFLRWVVEQGGPEAPQFGGHGGHITIEKGDPTLMPRIEDVLRRSGVQYYERGGALQRVVAADGEPDERGIERAIGAPYLRMVDEPYLFKECLEHIEFYRWSCNDLVPSDPPAPLLRRYVQVPEWWNVPRLAGMVHVPILRSDGSLCTTPGYDAATRLLYVPHGASVPAIPEINGGDQARAVIEELLNPFREFEWADGDVDRSIFVSLLLAGVLRPYWGPMPIGCFDAPQAGSGKTKLAECVSIVATGHHPTPVVLTGDSQEDRKRIDSILIAGDPVVLFDNLAAGTPLEGSTLNAAVTGEGLTIRPLGTSVSVRIPTTALFLVTGNHLQITGDVQTRCVISRLEPQCDDAHEREFTSEDPVRVVERERGTIVAKVLGLGAAWIRAGRPPAPSSYRLPAFDAIRGLLGWAGMADPLAGNRRAVSEDPERERVGALVHGIAALMKAGAEWRSRNLVSEIDRRRCDPDSSLHEIAEDLRDRLAGNALRYARGLEPSKLSAQSVGQTLNGLCNRPVRGAVLRKRRHSDGHCLFRIERTNE